MFPPLLQQSSVVTREDVKYADAVKSYDSKMQHVKKRIYLYGLVSWFRQTFNTSHRTRRTHDVNLLSISHVLQASEASTYIKSAVLCSTRHARDINKQQKTTNTRKSNKYEASCGTAPGAPDQPARLRQSAGLENNTGQRRYTSNESRL